MKRCVRLFEAAVPYRVSGSTVHERALDTKPHGPIDAATKVKEKSRARFEESVDVAVKLGIDPKRTDQPVRGAAALPHGIGKSVRVAAFAEGEQAERARDAGADTIGGAELASQIAREGASAITFDRAVATPAMVPAIRQAAKVLGPRGLMPTPRSGTVSEDLSLAVQQAKAGQVQFRADRYGIVHARIGSVSFQADALIANVLALMRALRSVRPPAGVPGGSGPLHTYFRGVLLSTTMSYGSVRADVSSLLKTL